ncbi:MAG: hypothetical protein DBY17_01375 [Oscillospiraceae bacterium]|nr:MAG: hypothetical protein DBY17_01375 [Oscillospiraceae bacterium]
MLTYESGNAFLLFALIAGEGAHSRCWAQAGEALIKLRRQLKKAASSPGKPQAEFSGGFCIFWF